MHEAQLHDGSAFLTLTYDDENLPRGGSLDVTHWQKFAKRLRKQLGPFRFIAAGEYGPNTLRPHYHAILFGHEFLHDRVPHKERKGHQTYLSESVAKLWPFGFHELGTVTYQSAAYVASYVTKKMGGDRAKETYSRCNPFTGEVHEVVPEFALMSRRPGLGAEWIKAFWKDVYPSDEVVMDGRKFRPPPYYDVWLADNKPAVWDEVRRKRLGQVEEKSYKTRAARHEILKSKARMYGSEEI